MTTLSELKKTTLLKYTMKANKKANQHSIKAHAAKDNDEHEEYVKQKNKQEKREKGISTAMKKLAKEEFEYIEEGVLNTIARKAKLATTEGEPNHKDAPKWATHIGKTPEGHYHWLEKHSELENNKSDSYFPNAGKTQYTGFHSKPGKGHVKPLKEEFEYIEEVLTAKHSASEWIDDFVHSKNPKFEGKSKKDRIKMALAAHYAAKRGE